MLTPPLTPTLPSPHRPLTPAADASHLIAGPGPQALADPPHGRPGMAQSWLMFSTLLAGGGTGAGTAFHSEKVMAVPDAATMTG